MKNLFVFVSMFSFTSLVNAELYKTTFVSQASGSGNSYNTGVLVDLNFTENGEISGEIKNIYNTSSCKWQGEKVTGGKFKDGYFRWETGVHPTQGCGRIVYVGKKEGDKIIGYFPKFNGVRVETSFKKE